MATEGRYDKNDRRPSARRRKVRMRIKITILVLEILALAVLTVALYLVTKLGLIQHDPTFEGTNIEQNELNDEVKETLKGYTTLALVGLDNRTEGTYKAGNADSIIVVSINNDTGEVRMASVYRDTYLQITSEGRFEKVNASYNLYGAKGLVETLNRNLDLAIEDYVAVDWYALANTIDLLGGVEIEISGAEANIINSMIKSIKLETDGKLQTERVAREGLNELDGVQALAYARIRSLSGYDYARTQRQRLVIEKMVEKAKTVSVGTLVSIVNEVFPSIATSLSTQEIISLATGIASYQLTETTGFPEKRGQSENEKLYAYIIPVSLLTNVEDLHLFLYGNDKYIPSTQLQNISNKIIYNTGVAPEEEE